MTEILRDPDLDRLIQELNRNADRNGSVAVADEPGDEAPVPTFTAAAGLPAASILGAGVPPPAAGAAAAGPAVSFAPSAAADGQAPLAAAAGIADAGEALARLLAESARRDATDVLLMPGLSPVFRISGRLKKSDADPLTGDDIVRLFQAQLAGRARREIEERGYADLSIQLPAAAVRGAAGDGGDEYAGELGGAAARSGAWRYRVNLHRQRGQLAAALRALPHEIPTLASLNLPPSLAELVKPSRGLVLVCGPTGSGKSSTLAALIGEINRTRTAHVITIEDPVEYEHRSNRSLIEHIEVGRDARSFSEALRAAMRQDPDIILVGEMRDLETMSTAVTAAETGHLVLATLHSNDAVQAVHRIVDVFPPTQQDQIRQQLALSLNAIVAQQLVPRADGRGRVPAIELMLASFAVRHHIRSDKLEKLYNEITLGKRQGMTSFEESLAQLVRDNQIDLEEARVRASHPEELNTRLRG